MEFIPQYLQAVLFWISMFVLFCASYYRFVSVGFFGDRFEFFEKLSPRAIKALICIRRVATSLFLIINTVFIAGIIFEYPFAIELILGDSKYLFCFVNFTLMSIVLFLT